MACADRPMVCGRCGYETHQVLAHEAPGANFGSVHFPQTRTFRNALVRAYSDSVALLKPAAGRRKRGECCCQKIACQECYRGGVHDDGDCGDDAFTFMHEMSAPQRECADEVDLEFSGDEFDTDDDGRITWGGRTYDHGGIPGEQGLDLEWVAVGGAPA